jgi:hypothetical protein
MAPTTRGKKAIDSSDLLDLINSSPSRKKAAGKKKAEAERRAAEAAKKAAAKEKSTKAKLIGAVPTLKPVTEEDIANYSMYDKKTAIILAKADAEIDYNVSKSTHYTELLPAFNHKKYPDEVATVKLRIKRYTKLVDDLRKGRARLIASAKLDKGKKKATDFDPNPLISSGKSSRPSLYLLGPSPQASFLPSALRPFLSFFGYYSLFFRSQLRAIFLYLRSSYPSASRHSASAMRLRAFFRLRATFGFAPFLRLRAICVGPSPSTQPRLPFPIDGRASHPSASPRPYPTVGQPPSCLFVALPLRLTQHAFSTLRRGR